MFRHSRVVFLSMPLLLVLLINLACPIVVYADGNTPPPLPTEPPAEETPVVENEVALSETHSVESEEVVLSRAVEIEAVSSETITADAAAGKVLLPETVSVGKTPSEPVAIPKLLEAAPEGTEITVLDENGSALPLASESAAEIVAIADPMWCPEGVLPGGPGCTTNFASPQALIDDMDASNPGSRDAVYEQNGVIYFTAASGGEFILALGSGNLLPSADYAALKMFNLTLQGGWNGLNDGAGFALNGQTDFGSTRVQIGSVGNPWGGNVTISNISIDGTSNTGLTVYTAGDIHLSSVDSQNNTGQGARLANDSGSGEITIEDSSFDLNSGHGLRVTSNGNITLSQVHASENIDSGAYLENTTGSGSISISDSSFDSNGVDGLEGYSNSDITVNNVTINNNTENGGSFYTDTGEGNVSIRNSMFNGNTSLGQDLGLEVISGGDVTLNEVTASNNQAGNGGYILGSSLLIANSTFDDNASNDPAAGLGLYAEGDEAEIVCSQFNGNSTYGIDATNVIVLTLDDVTFSRNTSGDYLGSAFLTSGGCTPDNGGGDDGGGEEGGGEEGGEEGSGGEAVPSQPGDSSHKVIPIMGLPLHLVPVKGTEKIDLDCIAYSGTKLVLPNGDSLILPCPLRDQGSLVGYAQNQLPGPLGDEFAFLSALDAEVLRDSEPVPILEQNMIISFIIPDRPSQATLAILRWDASQWVEVPGYLTDKGTFEATTPVTGVYALVTK